MLHAKPSLESIDAETLPESLSANPSLSLALGFKTDSKRVLRNLSSAEQAASKSRRMPTEDSPNNPVTANITPTSTPPSYTLALLLAIPNYNPKLISSKVSHASTP